MEFTYKAICIKQTNSDKLLAMFAAPATEIDNWAGVPQKKRFGTGEETVGFQREENKKRVDSLGDFCSNAENIIQNPLLCSTRKITAASTIFTPNCDEIGDIQKGTISITIPEYSTMTMKEILGSVRSYIEERVPDLANVTPDENLVSKYKALASELGHLPPEEPIPSSTEDESSDTSSSELDAEAALFEESHIVDFWKEVACRHEVVKLMDDSPINEFLGFTRESLLSYLRPVVLVDGQHRLKGSIKAAEDRLSCADIQNEIESRIMAGEEAEIVQNSILNREVRRLPVSLLLTDDPAEQV
ncbi:MAG: hypothetical protein AB7Y74_08030, partial [Syntrophorhabdus sp.]